MAVEEEDDVVPEVELADVELVLVVGTPVLELLLLDEAVVVGAVAVLVEVVPLTDAPDVELLLDVPGAVELLELTGVEVPAAEPLDEVVGFATLVVTGTAVVELVVPMGDPDEVVPAALDEDDEVVPAADDEVVPAADDELEDRADEDEDDVELPPGPAEVVAAADVDADVVGITTALLDVVG